MDGPFQIETAWTTHQKGTEQAVLLKRLQSQWPVAPESIEKFLATTHAISLLTDPYILKIIDSGVDRVGLFVVTEYIHGATLATIFEQMEKSESRFSVAQAMCIFCQLCLGVEKAHRQSIVHRGLCPNHVLVTFEGVVKIKDFGISDLYSPGVHSYIDTLDADYRIPPGKKHLKHSPVSLDWYALGATLKRLGSLLDTTSSEQNPQHTEQWVYQLFSIAASLQSDLPDQPLSSISNLLNRIKEISGDANWEKRNGSVGTLLRQLLVGISGTAKGNQPAATSPELSWLDPATFWDAAESSRIQPSESTQANEIESFQKNLTQNPGANEIRLPLTTNESYTSSNPTNSAEDVAIISSLPQQHPEMFIKPMPPENRPNTPLSETIRSSRQRSPKKEVKNPRFHDQMQAKRKKNSRPLMMTLILLAVIGATSGGFLLFYHVYAHEHPVQKMNSNDVISRETTPLSENSWKKNLENPADNQGVPLTKSNESATLKVSSEPTGAMVFVDDIKKGITPLRVMDLEMGKKISLKLTADGYKAWTWSFPMEMNGTIQEIHAQLRKIENCQLGTGWVYVTTDPVGAMIELNGIILPEKTPALISELCSGASYNIRIRAFGFGSRSTDVIVSAGEVKNVFVSLKP